MLNHNGPVSHLTLEIYNKIYTYGWFNPPFPSIAKNQTQFRHAIFIHTDHLIPSLLPKGVFILNFHH